MRLCLALFLACLLILLPETALSTASARQLVIYTSHDYISRNYEIQHFVDTLGLEAGQLELPLKMSIYNGSAEAPSYKWFRILINGEIIATEADLHGREIGTKDVTGIIQGSNLQVQIEAGGVPGASLWWTLSAEQMSLTGVEPPQVLPGQEFRIAGSNIPSTPDLLSVTVEGQPARIISASAESIVAQMPGSLRTGVACLQVRTAKQVANPLSITITSLPVPEISSIDCWMAPPGGTINISGRNFSANAVEDKVFFDKVPAEVRSASTTQLEVVVPNWPYGPSQLNIPISVEVKGVRSGNRFPFDIGPSYHGAIPQFGHD
jgi:hypothetical protein